MFYHANRHTRNGGRCHYFVAGAMLVEIIYVRISSLLMIDFEKEKFMKYMEWGYFHTVVSQ
jgi:hypothetical protein